MQRKHAVLNKPLVRAKFLVQPEMYGKGTSGTYPTTQTAPGTYCTDQTAPRLAEERLIMPPAHGTNANELLSVIERVRHAFQNLTKVFLCRQHPEHLALDLLGNQKPTRVRALFGRVQAACFGLSWCVNVVCLVSEKVRRC